MTPKIPSSTKKLKTTASTSGTSRAYDRARFLGPDQQDRFRELEKRKIWSEKQFMIDPH
ncbi:hypothetical protein A2U01_0065599, partial [Trifolium medium]|nr:hypothetical protein [Trifolium medium]